MPSNSSLDKAVNVRQLKMTYDDLGKAIKEGFVRAEFVGETLVFSNGGTFVGETLVIG